MLNFLSKFRFLHFVYFILFLSIVGELYRFPILIDKGVILTDIAVPTLVVVTIIYKLATRQAASLLDHPKVFRYILAFILISLLGLLLSFPNFSTIDFMKAAMYWVRFTSYALLGLLLYQDLKTGREVLKSLLVIIGFSVVLALLGFFQLIFFPDLASLVVYGWDPHINRLVSTWLDPNFVGGFLAFAFCIALALALHLKKSPLKTGLILSLVVLEFAIFFTYSRSAYLSFLIGSFVVTMFKSPKVYLIILLVFGLQMGSSSYAAQRVFSLLFNLDNITKAESKDPTANFRVRSWLDTISLSTEKPLLGHGYNNLSVIKNQRNMVYTDSQHSASGSDSSLLTILATTGVLGLIPFFLFYFLSFKLAWKEYFKKSKDFLKSSISLGALGGIAVLFIHSIFVNSLLYPPIAIFFFVFWAALSKELLSNKPS